MTLTPALSNWSCVRLTNSAGVFPDEIVKIIATTKPLKIEGIWTLLVLSAILTAAHGALWVALDYITW